MPLAKADIIAQLQKEILPFQGFKSTTHSSPVDPGLGPIKNAFPHHCFPLGAVHEFVCGKAEDVSATTGFIAGILASLMRQEGACIWISASRTIFPPALQSFGIAPEKIIFIDLPNTHQVLWAMEEALKCNSLAAVVGEIPDISFTASRRLQLVVEQSQVTGFILRSNSHKLHTTACLTRWSITSIPGLAEEDMPGLGFPRWNVDLLKVRNGKPGTWQVEWSAGQFRHPLLEVTIHGEQQTKTG